MQVQFLDTWILILLLPAALFLLFWAKRVSTGYRYSVTGLVKRWNTRWVITLARIVLAAALIALIGALARPVTDGGMVPVLTRTRDTVVLIDRSASMADAFPDPSRIIRRGAVSETELSKYDVSRLLAAEFIKLRPDDRIMVCVFDVETVCPLPLNRKDHNILLEWLYMPDPIGTGTLIAKALMISLRHLEEMGQSGKRTIILVSDGEEHIWNHDFEEEIRQLLRKTNTALYWVHVRADLPLEPYDAVNGSHELESQHALRRLIAETGGKELKTGSEKVLAEAFGKIAAIAIEPALITVLAPRLDLYPTFIAAALATLLFAFAWIRLKIR
jgi:hypothetical protein